MNDLLDLQFARGLEVRARPAHFGAHRAELVCEKTNGFRSADIDSEHVHVTLLCYSRLLRPIVSCSLEPPASVCGLR